MVITREDEANFPEFNSVDEARGYFVKRYGDKYNFGERELIGDEYIYFDDVDGQPVQVFQSGHVHVVY